MLQVLTFVLTPQRVDFRNNVAIGITQKVGRYGGILRSDIAVEFAFRFGTKVYLFKTINA